MFEPFETTHEYCADEPALVMTEDSIYVSDEAFKESNIHSIYTPEDLLLEVA